MRVGRNESWVTLVLNDEMGLEALVLAASLQRCHTQRKLSVLIDNSQVSDEMKTLLENQYDYVETIQNGSIVYTGNKVEETKMKAYIWSLLIWDKCVFISSSSLVVESIEDLFNLGQFSAPAVEIGGRQMPSMDLFVFKPNRDALMALTLSKTNSGDEAIMKYFWKSWSTSITNQNKMEILVLDEPSELHLHCPTPAVVKFNKKPWLPSGTFNGISKKYSTKWLEIYIQDILPAIQSNEKLCQFLKMSSTKYELPLPLSPVKANLPTFSTLDDAIAVVGMSCRFPGANNVEEYWDLLISGGCAVRKFPCDRRTFDLPGIQDLVAGFLSCPIDEFDAKFFGISPREAPLVDPQQRLLLEVIWESLEDAGLDGVALKDTPTGVFIGVHLQDYDRLLPRNGYIGNEYHHRFLGNAISAIAGRISHFMGFTGPNLALESGSSSSLGTLHLACQSLRSGEVNLAISGGVNLILIPRGNDATIASNDGSLTANDETAPGEGVATLVLKRYADALNDGDKIRAIIRGSALTNAGGSSSFGSQVPSSQARVCKEALKNARVDPKDVSYVETQGMLDDFKDVEVLSQVYAGDRKQPLWIGSVTGNVGAGGSAAGIASLFKLILALEKEAIPKNLFSAQQNPRMAPACFATQLIPWVGPHRVGAASSSSITGTLVHVLLESNPEKLKQSAQLKSKDPATAVRQLVTISAKSPEALESQRQNYLEFFRKNAQLSLSEVAYATNMCRTHFQHRLAIVAENMKDLITKLEQEDFLSGKVPGNFKSPPIGFLFTGQASQYFGMGKSLYDLFPPFQTTIDYCSGIYSELVGCPLTKVLWEDETLLAKTEYGQPALFCIQIGLVKLWAHFGIIPDIVLGHSVGEYAAAVAAGIISIAHGLRLVTGRSRLVHKLKPGRMMAIKASHVVAVDLLAQLGPGMTLDVAAVNSPTETVLSGSPAAIEAFGTLCASKGIKTHLLSSSHAFHSRDIDEILDEFGQIAEGINYGPPTCPFISSTLGRKMEQDDFSSEYWQCHLRETVRFSTGIGLVWAVSQTLIEIGPQPVLLNLAMTNNTGNVGGILCCPSMRRIEENWTTFLSSLGKLHVAGVGINWKNWFGKRTKNVQLPLYAFQRQKYWFVLKDYTDEEDDKDREGFEFQTKRIHPILGYKIQTPHPWNLFVQSKLLKELPYLKECQIGENSILPPGGVLELFLAVANQQTPKSPLLVTDIHFNDYMQVDDQTKIQTAAEEAPQSRWNLKLFKEMKGGEWNVAATGQIMSAPDETENAIEFDWEKMKIEGVAEVSISTLYNSRGQIQVHFGPNYRRILQAWKTGDGTIVTKLGTVVQDPQVIGHSTSEYICYPTVLDAMVQTARLAQRNMGDWLCLPQNIAKFVWYGKEAKSDELMCLAGIDWVHLVTARGDLIAKLEGIKFMSELSLVKLQTDDHLSQNSNFLTAKWIPVPSSDSPPKISDKTYMAFGITKDDELYVSEQFVKICLFGDKQGFEQVSAQCIQMGGLQNHNYDTLFDKYPLDGLGGVVYIWLDNNAKHIKYFQGLLAALGQHTTASNIPFPPVILFCRHILKNHTEMARLDTPTVLSGWQMLQNFAVAYPVLKISLVDIRDEDVFSCDNLKSILASGLALKEKNVFAVADGKVLIQTLAPLALTPKLSLQHAERLAGTIQTKQSSPSFNSLQLRSIFAQGLGPCEVEVAVEACALNYRDIFQIMRPDGFIPPSSTALGYDISGRITAVSPTASKFNFGDQVFGVMTQGDGLSTHVRISEGNLSHKPHHMSFASASTIPLAFLTAWKCLIKLGKLTSEDRVLVSLGLGGTGLAFVQICRHIGAKVFVLADTEQGLDYLRSIGIKNVYSSRTADYVERIQEDTKGAGVTVVINSFSTAKFKEASLHLCASGGKFVEIGGLHLWSLEEVKQLRSDVDYQVVNLLAAENGEETMETEIRSMLKPLEDLFEKGQLTPLPVKTFPLEFLQDAFVSCHNGKFIGKTIIQMPLWVEEESRWEGQLFNKNSTYLITGNFQEGFADWMIQKGAEYILILHTNPAPIQGYETKNHVERIYMQSYQECKEIQGRLRTLGFPPLRGIFHGEGLGGLTSIQDSTPWFLHNLSKKMQLDFFVICATGFDVNSCAGWICKQRHLAGLPAIYITASGGNGMGSNFQLLEEILGRHLPFCVISKDGQEVPVLEKTLSIEQGVDDGKVGKQQEGSFAQKLELLLRQTLRLPPSELLDLDQNFTEIGVDSLMGLEIGTKIQEILPNIQVSPTVVQEYPTMRSILAFLNQ